MIIYKLFLILASYVPRHSGITRKANHYKAFVMYIGSLPPPHNISLIGVTRKSSTVNMTFNWQPPLRNCPTIGYSISPKDCGRCTNINTTSIPQTISCEDIDLPKYCTVTVESHTCADFSTQGRSVSKPLFINLEGKNN